MFCLVIPVFVHVKNAFSVLPPFPGSRAIPQVRHNARKDRRDLYKLIDADYYGYRDDEDGLLAKEEAVAEAQGT